MSMIIPFLTKYKLVQNNWKKIEKFCNKCGGKHCQIMSCSHLERYIINHVAKKGKTK